MNFKSNINEVLSALNEAKRDICDSIGAFGKAEAQNRATVLSGLMRRSVDYQVHDDNNGVDIGVTAEAKNEKGDPYPLFIELGSSHNKAQPFLEPAVMDNIGKIEEIAGQKISAHMGSK